MCQIKQSILDAVPTNEWWSGSQIREKAQTKCKSEISIGRLYSELGILVHLGIVQYYKPREKGRGKFKKSSTHKKIFSEMLLAN